MSSSISELWKQAVESYYQRSGRNEEDKNFMRNIKTPEDIEQRLLVSQTRFEEFRKKGSKLTAILKRCMQPFIALSSVGSSALSATPFAPASVIFGAVVFLVQAANGVSEAYDWIESLFFQLLGFTERLSEYVSSGMSARLKGKIIDIFSCTLEIMGCAEKAIKRQRLKQYAVALFLGHDERTKAAFEKLAELFKEEQMLLLAVAVGKTHKIEKGVDYMNEKIENVKKELQEMHEKSVADDMISQIKSYFETPGHLKSVRSRADYQRTTMASTGSWLINDLTFISWINRKYPLVWICGGPGTGKSHLSYKAIEKLESVYPPDTNSAHKVSMAYFYIKENDPDLTELASIFKSIAYQISDMNISYRQHLAKFMHEHRQFASPIELWKEIFIEFFADPNTNGSAMIVLDGLDEAQADTVQLLFDFFEDIDFSSAPSRLSFLIFSRPEVHERIGTRVQNHALKIVIRDQNAEDIKQYVKGQIPQVALVKETLRIGKSKEDRDELQRKILRRVLKKADGLFFKAALIMSDIKDRERKSILFQTIEKVPPKLEAMIAQTFKRVFDKGELSFDDFREILIWTAFSKRPLMISELYTVLKMRTGEAYTVLMSRLQGRFASLVHLEPTSGLVQNPTSETEENLEEELETNESGAQNGTNEPMDAYGDDFDSGDDLSDEMDDLEINDDQPKGAFKGSSNDDNLNDKVMKEFWRTQVRISHASIRDYITSNSMSNSDIALQYKVFIRQHDADIRIAMACMESIMDPELDWTVERASTHAQKPVMRSEEEYFREDDGSPLRPCLLPYAAEALIHHLKAIDLALAPPEDRTKLLRQFCYLFCDPTGIRKLIVAAAFDGAAFLKAAFPDDSLADHLRTKWFVHLQKSSFSESQERWIKEVCQNQKELFRNLALEAARMWLTGAVDDPIEIRIYCFIMSYKGTPDEYGPHFSSLKMFLIWIVGCYIYQASEASNDDFVVDLNDSHTVTHFRSALPVSKLNHLDRLVTFGNPEKTAAWHKSYAEILVRAGCIPEAVEYYKKAFSMDESLWHALPPLACCLAYLGDFSQALLYVDKVPPSEIQGNNEWRFLQNNMVQTAIRAGAHEAVLRFATTIWEREHTPRSFAYIIQALFKMRRYDAIVEMTKQFDEIEASNSYHKIFLLEDVWWEMGWALWHQNQSHLIKSLVFEALESCRMPKGGSKEYGWPLLSIVEYLMAFFIDVDEGCKLVEEAVAAGDFQTYDYGSFYVLPPLYLLQATSSIQSGRDIKEYTQKLTALAACKSRASASTAGFLGFHLRRNAQAPESEWKPHIRQLVVKNLETLSQTEGRDDAFISAFHELSDALLAAGDIPNAKAAAAVYLRAASCHIWEQFEDDVHFNCHGVCGRGNSLYTNYFEEVYACLDCFGVTFCEACYGMIQNGSIPQKNIHSKHEFLQIYPASDDLMNAAGEIDNITVTPNKEFITRLAESWKVEAVN